MRMALCAIQVSQPMTDSVFPELEEWLTESSDHQNALQWVASRKDMDRYRTMVDFLLCEILPWCKAPCLAFYEDKGPPFREVVDKASWPEIEAVLKTAVEQAHEMHKADRALSWKAFRDEVLELVA